MERAPLREGNAPVARPIVGTSARLVGRGCAAMTRLAKKQRERFYASLWLQRRGVSGLLEEGEHPDFVVRLSAETLGIEIVEYHGGLSNRAGSKGRQVEASWEALQDYSDAYRSRNSDIDRVHVRLHFHGYRMPPKGSFRAFCSAVARLIREGGDLNGRKLMIRPDAEIEPLLAEYLMGVELFFGKKSWRHWEWPAYMNGPIGTSDDELHSVVAQKLATYRSPPGVDSSHLVIVGGGPARTRIAAPMSAPHLSRYWKLNHALRGGPFDTVAILCLRDFIWSRADGWVDFAPYQ